MPYGALISDGTFLYGMTNFGGASNVGTIFKIKTDGTGYADLMDFNTTNGAYPNGSLISDGTFLYGVTTGGGIHNVGAVFKIKPDGTGYTKLLDFPDSSNAWIPYGSLVYNGTNLFGVTNFGGTGTCSDGCGTIFELKPDGTGFSKMLDFTGTANGSFPWGSLISAGNFLYGMTTSGGINDSGVVYEIKPDGTGYSKLLDFSGAANGSIAFGSLYTDGTCFYGMTNTGGANHLGTIFKINPAGMGVAENNLKNDFTISPNPFSETATLRMTNPQITNPELTIYNVFGQKVYNQFIRNSTFVISRKDLSDGMYFLQVKTSEGSSTKKIIIRK